MAEKSYEDEAETLFATFPELRDVAAPVTLMENMNAAHIQFLNLTDQSPPQRNDAPHTPSIRRNQVPLVSATVQQHSPPQQTPAVAASQAEHSSPEVANTPASQVEVQPPQNGGPSPSVSVTGKRIRWSELEHKLFLLGLEKCGKGDWQNISRYYVKTKTSAQVASHAQKYFLRHNGSSKEKKRKSIHDITLQNKRPVSHHHVHQNVPSPKTTIPQQSHPMNRSVPSTNLAIPQLHNVHHLVPHHNINSQQQNRVPSPNLTIQRSPNMHHSVPHHIEQQRWAPSTNLAVQQLHDVHHLVPHHNNQQNRYPSPNLTIQRAPNMHHSVPHHIGQQRWVPSTNLAVQQLNDVHHLVPHYNNQQSRVPSPNLTIQQSPNMHHSVPQHIGQKSWAPSTNFAMQQIHNVHHSLPHQIYHQNRTPTNIAMQQPHRMHLTQEMIHMNPPVNMPHQMGGFNNGFPPNNVSSYGRI